MITDAGKLLRRDQANGSGLAPFTGSVPSLPAEMTRTMPALTARCIAASNGWPGVDAAERQVDDPGAGEARSVDACGDRVVEELAAVGAGRRSMPGIVGALADDRRVERDAHRVRPVARRGRDRADRRAVAAFVADAAIAGDVAAGRIDPAGEFGEVRIDAAVDDADLDALAGRARVVGGDRVGRRPTYCDA